MGRRVCMERGREEAETSGEAKAGSEKGRMGRAGRERVVSFPSSHPLPSSKTSRKRTTSTYRPTALRRTSSLPHAPRRLALPLPLVLQVRRRCRLAEFLVLGDAGCREEGVVGVFGVFDVCTGKEGERGSVKATRFGTMRIMRGGRSEEENFGKGESGEGERARERKKSARGAREGRRRIGGQSRGWRKWRTTLKGKISSP